MEEVDIHSEFKQDFIRGHTVILTHVDSGIQATASDMKSRGAAYAKAEKILAAKLIQRHKRY